MKRLLGLGLGAIIGGAVGYSQVLCFGGQCAITGSWYGGAMLGGVLGFLLAGGCPACAAGRCDVSKPGSDPPQSR